MLFKDPRSEAEFNKNIDIDSFLPLYCFPLRQKKIFLLFFFFFLFNKGIKSYK